MGSPSRIPVARSYSDTVWSFDAADEPVDITTDLTIGYQLSEGELLAAIVTGEVDMAFVGARAFPRFDALLAPFLVDNYELQQAVFDASIP